MKDADVKELEKGVGKLLKFIEIINNFFDKKPHKVFSDIKRRRKIISTINELIDDALKYLLPTRHTKKQREELFKELKKKGYIK